MKNKFGRPPNWADDTVEALVWAYSEGGVLKAESLWLEIQERDNPKLCDAVVATGRFREVMKL